MTKKKVALKVDTYGVVSEALEKGLGFALNRLDDILVNPLSDDARDAAMDPMLNELMGALSEVVKWED